MIQDKAGRAYWNNTEANRRVSGPAFDGHTVGLKHFAKRQWHSFFVEAFSGIPTGANLLELGCGGSKLLPYFSTEFGFKISGIDYSESGCETAREMCRINNCQVDIVCCDFFAAPLEMKGQFDAVVSFGVVEHFTDTARALDGFKSFLKPGGRMITTLPNLGGIPGMAQRVINHDIFEKHVVLTVDEVRTAHELAGLKVLQCEYFLFMNFGVVTPGSAGLPRQWLWQGLRAVTGLSWLLESVVGSLPPNRASSPYIFCLSEYQ